MFSTLSDFFFGPSVVDSGTSVPPQGQGQDVVPESKNLATEVTVTQNEDDWVIVKNEEESFLLSTEIVTRNRVVDLHEDLSRENFLIEHPLSLSSEEIELRVIKIGRKKRKGKRNIVVQNPHHSKILSLISNPRNPHKYQQSTNSSRALTPITLNNKRYQSHHHHNQKSSGENKRRSNYHFLRFSGANNNRKCHNQRTFS